MMQSLPHATWKGESKLTKRFGKNLLFVSLVTLLLTAGSGLVLAGPLTIGGDLSTSLTVETDDPNELSNSNSLELKFDKSTGSAGIHAGVVLEDSAVTLDEAYLDYYGAKYDLRVGQQRIVWGTALEVNPTDVINPINLQDPMGDKLPVMAVNGTYYLNDWLQVTGVYLPFPKPAVDRLPTPSMAVKQPDPTFDNSEYAVKLKAVGVSGADFSVSYFSGKEDRPTSVSPSEAIYRDREVIGADFATAIGDVGLWAEAALTQVDGVNDDFLSWIVGGDYRFDNGLYLAAQYAQVQETDGDSNLVIGAMERDFAGIHHWKMGAVYNTQTQAYALMPEVTFSLADSTNLILGAKILDNDDQSLKLLGQVPGQVSAELEMSF